MMDRMTTQVLAKLIELQDGQTDAEFATLLGLSRSHWTHIRAGRRQLTYAITKRAARQFPEIYPLVMQDLAGSPARAAS